MTAGSSSKRGRGRPRVDAVNVGVRVPPDQLAPLDRYIADQPEPKPGRPEAIRAILADWLADRGYHVGSADEPDPRRQQQPRSPARCEVPDTVAVDAREPTDEEVGYTARRMCAHMGVEDVYKLDAKGDPMWQRYVAGARRMLSRRGRTAPRGGSGG